MNTYNQPITDCYYDRTLAVKCINGTFVGLKQDNIISYKGIPFVGAQPVGNLRWKAPVAFAPDNGVYEACHFANMSVQDLSIGDLQGEDCLYLNIWKADSSSHKRPVMVWVHGGAFTSAGTALEVFDCANLAKQMTDDPTCMTKEEYFRRLDEADKGPSVAMLPEEDLTTFLRRQGYDL